MNTHMVEHLTELGLWSEAVKQAVGNANGSIQAVPGIPAAVKEIYKTVWEFRQYDLMRRASIRSAFIDQSYSMNIYLNRNDNDTLLGVFLAGWQLGATTGSYYIRFHAASKPQSNNQVSAEVCAIGCTDCSA
jgi:ribonucleotide reductase alpha subunit